MAKIRLMYVLALCDLSRHNPGSRPFLDTIFNAPAVQSTRKQGRNVPISVPLGLNHADDCSFAIGVGLAVAHCGWLHGRQAQTVRPSDPSPDEMGDNVVLFGDANQPVPGLWANAPTVPPERPFAF